MAWVPFVVSSQGRAFLRTGFTAQAPRGMRDCHMHPPLPAMACLQTMSIRIRHARTLVHFLRSRSSDFARTRSLRMIAVMASLLHLPEATE